MNLELEDRFFGHQALIHAPLYFNDEFYGILEPAVRDNPREWTDDDRALIESLQPQVAELCAEFLGLSQS